MKKIPRVSISYITLALLFLYTPIISYSQTFTFGSNPPTLFGDLLTNAVGIGTSNLAVGASLTLAGNESMPASGTLIWNSDAGISRVTADSLAIGNGGPGDISGTLLLGQLNLQGNVNLTQVAAGIAQLGVGGVAGNGGSLDLNNLTAIGKITSPILNFSSYPIFWNAPDGPNFFSTQSYTVVGLPFISPYQNIIALGDHTLNSSTHNSPSCGVNSISTFCGDEVAFGAYTLSQDVNGRDNTAVGDHALANLTSGAQNTFVGSSAGANISTASNITGIGASACQNITSSNGPLECIGVSTLQSSGSNSQYSTALGFQSMFSVSDAEFSIGIGSFAAYNAQSAISSVLLGFQACANATALNNVICIGRTAGPSTGSNMSNTLWIGGPSPIIEGDLSSNNLTFGGNAALGPGATLTWNSDTGISRDYAGDLLIGNGTAGDLSGGIDLAQLSIGANVNITQISYGLAQVGSGTARGANGSLMLKDVLSNGFVRYGQTTFENLGAMDPSPEIGDQLVIVDALSCTANIQVSAGGGTNHGCLVAFNGVGWIAIVSH